MLTILHTVWIREHNRIAVEIQRLNPSWDDEKLFQETKKIVIAEYQHIVYKEWLPIVMGKEISITGTGRDMEKPRLTQDTNTCPPLACGPWRRDSPTRTAPTLIPG